jgi:outer membrane receptor protein involved in Fe transport
LAGPVTRAGRRRALALALIAAAPAGAGEIPESADDPSAFSTVLEARDYDERFATVEDLLERAPGVRVRRYGGLGASSTASIRGSKAEQVLVLVDGVRVASTERGAFDFSTLPLREVERVEILRGGGAARFGSDALGGVISITTRRPEGPEPSADVALGGGTHETLGGDLSLAAGGEKLRALASYTRLRSENDFEFEPYPVASTRPRPPGSSGQSFTRLNSGFVENGGLLRGELGLDRGSQLDALLWVHDRDGGQPGSAMGTAQSDEQLSCPRPDEGGTRGLARLGWRGALGRDGGLEISGYHRRESSTLDDPDGACGLVNPIVTGGRTRSRLRENSSGLELLALAPAVEAGPAWLSARASASLRHDGADSDDTQAQRRTSHALSLSGEAELWDRRLRILPALGFEAARSSDGLARGSASQAFERVSLRDESAWLPGIGAIAELAPDVRFKANWKRAFRRPSFSELFYPDRGEIRGNPELRSERAWNADAGLELAAGRAGPARDLFLQIVAFQREIDESIEWVLASSGAITPLNTGPARVRGVELSAALRLPGGLDLELSQTWTDARFESGDPFGLVSGLVEPLFPHVPERASFARAGLALGATHLYTELRYESEVGFQTGNAKRADSALQVDAGISILAGELPGLSFLPRGLSISLDGVNLGREQRYDSLGLPLPREALFFVRLRAVTP